jgi:hypothetical protein
MLAALSLAAPAQAAVLSAAGGLQGAAVFAAANGSLESANLLAVPAPLGANVLSVKPIPRVNTVKDESDSQIYAMIALGVIGFTLIRRRRYGRS